MDVNNHPFSMSSIILSSIVLLLAPHRAEARDSLKAIVLSPRVGPVIRAEDRQRFLLFPQFDRYDSAVVLGDASGNFFVRIMYTSPTGSYADTAVPYSRQALANMAEKVDHFDEVRNPSFPPEVQERDPRGRILTFSTTTGRVSGELLSVREGEIVVCRAAGMSNHDLQLHQDSIVRIPMENLVSVHAEGRSYVLLGVAIGVLPGIIVGEHIGAKSDKEGDLIQGLGGAAGAGIGFVAGGLIGGLIGAACSTSDISIPLEGGNGDTTLRQYARFGHDEPDYIKELK